MESALEGVPRTYRIKRSQHLGYGFIAGYEQPTMVKIIEPNGPSYKRLLPGDVIMAVNGIDVENAPREQIIKMIQLCEDEIEIKVRQPTYEEIIRAKNLADPKFYMFNKLNNHHQQQQVNTSTCSNQRPLPAVLKQRIYDNGIIADKDGNNNHINGASTLGRGGPNKYGRHSPLPQRCKSSIDGTQTLKACNKKSGDTDNDQPLLKRSNTMRPIRPPAKVMEIFEVVIRIFFEDGHTRVLNYNQDTTVGTILETLNARYVGSSPHSEQIKRYFGLALTVNSEESPKEQQLHKRKLLHILDDNDSIMKIRQLPYAPKLRLLYRMIYPPSDVGALYMQDKVAFEYLYKQSCNDLRADRFCPTLDTDTVLKLGALHLVEYVYSNHPKAHGNSRDPKLYMKLIKKVPGIDYFLPASMVESMMDKKGKRIVGQYKKLKSRLTEQLLKNFEDFDFEPPKIKSTNNLNRYTSTSFHELSLPEFQSSPSEYVKLVFLNYLSQLPCYNNTKRPVRVSASPIERSSVGDCSSSLESVPLTSDSSPLIRQEQQVPQTLRQQDYNSIERLYDQRYVINDKSIDELLKTAIILPPPPASTILFNNVPNYIATRKMTIRPSNYITPVLTDQDLERLRVPPPPKMTN